MTNPDVEALLAAQQLGLLASPSKAAPRGLLGSVGQEIESRGLLGALRYYMGPHLTNRVEAVANLAGALTPTFGMQSGAEAKRSFDAGNYGTAAIQTGKGMMEAALDAIPASKLPLAMAAAMASKLPMDEASRMARAKEMGHSETPYYRGDKGKDPSEYPSGAHFTSDPDYNDGGFGQNREFRLNLQNAFHDGAPVTAGQYARLIEAAKEADPKLAKDLAAMFDKDVDWMIGFGRALPDTPVAESGALVRAMIDRSAAPEQIFKKAGFDALVSGHEVRKLTGAGIRHKDAKFDPDKADDPNIFAGLAGLGLLGAGASAMYPTEDRHWE